MSIKRRAITDDQKQQRRQKILDTAWTIFQDKPYEAITVAEVAEAAKLAKGTVYLYFQTKEELFLAIQEQQLEIWFDEVDRLLVDSRSIEDVGGIICDSLHAHPAMIRLFTILHTVLEHNIGYNPALQFKQMLLRRIGVTSVIIAERLPFLTLDKSIRFFLWAYALVIGLQQLANPAPLIQEILSHEPDMAPFQLDFCGECKAALIAMLTGLEKNA